MSSIAQSRRAFLQAGTLFLTTAAFAPRTLLAADESAPALKIGLMTDLHHADKQPNGTRHYRDTLKKLEEAGEKFKAEKVTTLIELGDIVDAADTVEKELGYLKTVNEKFSAICEDHHYVLGNHCVDFLTKEEFLGGAGKEKSYYSFDRAGVHCIILDACFNKDLKPYGRKNSQWNDANIPAAELDWLKEDLKSTTLPTVVFAHQKLDVANNHGVKNAADVRKIFEESGKVQAVFQGHSHISAYTEIAGIHYCTLVAMVEGQAPDNNGYSILEIRPGAPIKLSGFRKQTPYEWVKKNS